MIQLILQIIKQILELFADRADRKTDAVSPDPDEQSERDLNQYLSYCANVRYSQTKETTDNDEYSGRPGTGAAYYIKLAQEMEFNRKTLPVETRKQFLSQNPTECAKYLCIFLSGYMLLEACGKVKKDSLPEFMLWAVRMKYLTASDCMFCWIASYRFILDKFKNGKEKKFITTKDNSQEDVIYQFESSGMRYGLARKGNRSRGTHTYLLHTENMKTVMYDTYHSKWTGKEIEERHPKISKLWYIRGYA